MKTILYPDQNHVSCLTKGRIGLKVYPDVAAHYLDLYDALLDAIRQNTLVCPMSSFHIDESALDTRLEPKLHHTLAELSYGTEFLFWVDILQRQVIAALHRYFRAPPPESQTRWEAVFNRDPDEPYVRSSGPIRASRIGSLLEVQRAAKLIHERWGNTPASRGFQAQKRAMAQELIWLVYRGPWQNLRNQNFGLLAAGSDKYLRLQVAVANLTGKNNEAFVDEHLDRFLESDELVGVPFVDIYSSLRAAMASDENRRPKGSDLQDVLIAATVLPYSGVFATDSYVKDLVQRLKLDKQYNVSVFGGRKVDVLALTALVRALTGR